MSKRMLIAVLALCGVFLSLYLTMYKAGMIGTLACGTGECETVQLSRWATFLGLPVAAWGVGFYLAVLVLSLVGVQERFANSRGFALGLVLVTGWGVLFSVWLTYLELFVIHAICRWCVGSALLTVVLFAITMMDYRAWSAGSEQPVGSEELRARG